MSAPRAKLEFVAFAVLLGILLILIAAGTALPVIASADNSVQFTMWQKRQISQGTTVSTNIEDLQSCGRTKEPLQAASVFAILAIVSNVVGIIVTVLDTIKKPVHKWATELTGSFLWMCTAIVWILQLVVFKTPICGNGFVPSASGYTLSTSFALFVTTFVLLTISVGLMWAMKAYIRPHVIEKEPPHPLDGTNALERRKSTRSFQGPPSPSMKKPSSAAAAYATE